MANQGGGKGNDPKKKGQGNFNEMILGGLKSRAGKETTRWVKGLTDDASAEDLVLGAIEKRDAGPAPTSPLAWVDKLFDLFQQYEVELNRVTSDQPELRLGSDRPVFTNELLTKLQNDPDAEYRGRVFTREWTLAITGNLEHTEGHIIPSQHFIAFTANESNFTRYFDIRPLMDNEGMKWTCDGGVISWDRLSIFAKQVLGGLIHVARDEASEHDPFIFNPTGLEAIRMHKSDADAPLSPFLEHGPLLATEEQFTADTVSLSPGRPGSESGAMQSMVDNVRSEPQKESGKNRDKTDKRSIEPPQREPQQERSRQQEAYVEPKTVHATQSASDLTLNGALDLFARVIERELEVLSRNGARAFEAHDFTAVEQTLKKSTKVKQLRDKVQATVQEWKSALAED